MSTHRTARALRTPRARCRDGAGLQVDSYENWGSHVRTAMKVADTLTNLRMGFQDLHDISSLLPTWPANGRRCPEFFFLSSHSVTVHCFDEP